MYKIVVAGPEGPTHGVDVDCSGLAAHMFDTDASRVHISMRMQDIAECDAVIFPGGAPDVSPVFYGEENTSCAIIDFEQDKVQMELFAESVRRKKPIFGICRGMQLGCVYFGATMIQDIETRRFHETCLENPHFHDAFAVPGTVGEHLFGPVVKINSAHHQAIKYVPKELGVSQIWTQRPDKASLLQGFKDGTLSEGSSDCIIETVYHKTYPFFAVQWHPEMDGKWYCHEARPQKIIDHFFSLIEANH
ncbi:MAG: gamma-glutamyl-gamma-aminobutyrate hydrolase family protein [Enterocloster bolteae]|uniref:gamma-glutamyl-gamma-aminobutyrate hydrolase family protein n=1 Tax=Enterocloster bolteae TaxID=208479 RepID=UPI0039941F73